MQKTKLLVALLATLAAAPVLAADAAPASPHTFTSNVSVVNDYLYRGISQTGTKPAIQGGFDYAHASGFYAGAWGSSISWLGDAGTATNAGLELDTYAGYKAAMGDVGYDVGFLRYNYPGTYAAGTTKADTDELYGALSYKFFSAKYSYSLGKTFGVPDAKGTDYFDLSANYPIEGTGVTVGAHLGKQTFHGSSAAYKLATAGVLNPNYTDYKLSVTKDFSGYVVGVAYSKTNAKTGAGTFYRNLQGKDLGQGRVVLSLTRSF